MRDWLTGYLDQRLGLQISPNNVRLQPRPDDQYSWSFAESQCHLFKSSLSNGSVGTYQALCSELGRSIEAVPPHILQDSVQIDDHIVPHDSQAEKTPASDSSHLARRETLGDDSFTATIQHLEHVRHELEDEIRQVREQAEQEIQTTQQKWQKGQEQLQREVMEWKAEAERRASEISRIRASVAAALETLQEHGSEPATPPLIGRGDVTNHTANSSEF